MLPKEGQEEAGPETSAHPLEDQINKKAGGETSTRKRFDSGVSSSR